MKWIKRLKQVFNSKVLLCDLDGTLIVTKSGKIFPENKDDWQLKPWICEAITEYNPRYIFIISNQGGIEKGFISENDFRDKLSAIVKEIRSWGDYIVEGTFCSSNDPENYYRKPNIGMIDFYRHAYVQGYDFDNRNALMIGDASGFKGQFSDSDLQTAKNAGIRYCDVDKFIEAMCPCKICGDINAPCGIGEYPMLPCTDSKSTRLKKVIVK